MSQNRKATAAAAAKAAETAPPAPVETPADQGDTTTEPAPEAPAQDTFVGRDDETYSDDDPAGDPVPEDAAPVEDDSATPPTDDTVTAPEPADLGDGCDAEHSPASNPDCDVAPGAIEPGSPAQLDASTDTSGEPESIATPGEEPQAEQETNEAREGETAGDSTDLADEDLVAALEAEATAAAQTEAPAPSSAVIDPPPEPAAEEKPLVIPDTVNEAAAERLRVTEAQVTIRDVRGNQLDPDAVFSAKGPDGLRQCLVRLIQHSTQTLYDRHIETLLLPAGAYIGPDSAETIIENIRAEQA